MKKFVKKLSALALAVIMLAALCAPALATSTHEQGATATPIGPGSTATVVVGVKDPTEKAANGGDKLLAYQVVSIEFKGSENTLDYRFTELFNEFLADDTGKEWKGLSPKAYGELDEGALKPLLGAFTAYIKKQNLKPEADENATADGDGVATFTGMAMGQYIIVGDGTSKGAKIYQTVTAEVQPEIVYDENGKGSFVLYDSYSVAMKTSKPDITKKVDAETAIKDDQIPDDKQATGDKNTDHKWTSEIGKPVTYTLTINVPTYPEGATNRTFFVGDLLSKGLTLDETSIVVKGINGEETTPLNNNDAYTTTITGGKGDATQLFIDFAFAKLVTAGCQQVVVTYTASINEHAELGTATGNRNNVDLIYSNSPFDGMDWKPGDGDRPDDKTDGFGDDKDMEIVYTYALVIDKFEEKQEGEKLAGAQFELYRKWDGTDYSDPVNDAGGKIITLTTDANGAAKYEGLAAGTYYLKETIAPAGFNLMDEPVIVKIDAKNIPFMTETKQRVTHYTYTSDENEIMAGHTGQAKINGVFVWMNTDGEVKTANEGPADFVPAYVKAETTKVENVIEITKDTTGGAGYYKADVANDKGAQLPSTGGVGTTIFYIVGGCLALGAVILLVTKFRMTGKAD